MKWQLTVAHKGLLLALMPLVLSLLSILWLDTLVSKSEAEYDHQQAAKQQIIDFDTDALKLANCIYTFMSALNGGTQTPAQLEEVKDSLFEIKRRLTRHKKSEPALKEKINTLVDDAVVFVDLVQSTNARETDPDKRWRYIRPEATKLMIRSLSVAPQLLEQHNASIGSIDPDRQARLDEQIGITFLGYVLATVALAVALGIWFSKDLVERLRIINKNAESIAIKRPLSKEISGSDELASLDRVLHETALTVNESRRRELAVIDLASEVVFSVDKRGRFVTIGQPASKQWLYSPDELLSRPFTDIVAREAREAARAFVEEAAANSDPKRLDTVILRKDEQRIDCDVSIRLDEKSETLVCVAINNTERKRIERMKQRFVSIVSHDLRTPLASVSSSLALLAVGARGEIDEASLSRIRKCEDSIDRLMALIQDLLDMERLESGKFPLSLSCVSAYDVCDSAVESLLDLASGKHVKIERRYADAPMLGDEKRLIQVMVNLMSNAVKFSPENGTVTVSSSRDEDEVIINVSDQGPGIDAVEQSKIFDRFEQASGARQIKQKGTGLGLAISRAIVDAHSGKIGVESEPGRGSRFWIAIPVYRDAGDEGGGGDA